jgi:hypothetical protein
MKNPPKLVINVNMLVATLRNRLRLSFALMQRVRERRAALGSPNTAQAAWDKVGDKGALADDQWTK